MDKCLSTLYELAAENDIQVDEFCPRNIISMSVRFKNGKKIIGLSKFDSDVDYNVDDLPLASTKLECFAHEMGHCMTDSFYEEYSPLEKRSKHEYRANKWAIFYLIPFTKLCQAVSDGYRELWQLADYFMVSPAFVENAIYVHASYGNIVPKELYSNE